MLVEPRADVLEALLSSLIFGCIVKEGTHGGASVREHQRGHRERTRDLGDLGPLPPLACVGVCGVGRACENLSGSNLIGDRIWPVTDPDAGCLGDERFSHARC